MHLEREKLYGLWGYVHVLQAGVNKSKTMSGLLAKTGKRVVSMPVLFKDSEMLVHRDNVPFMFRKKGEMFVRMSYPDADSPYRTKLKFVKVSGLMGSEVSPNDPDHTVTTNYFQYIFVARHFPAVGLWAESQAEQR